MPHTEIHKRPPHMVVPGTQRRLPALLDEPSSRRPPLLLAMGFIFRKLAPASGRVRYR